MRTGTLPEVIDSPAVVCPAVGSSQDNEASAAAETRSGRPGDLYLDLFERCLVVGFYGWLVVRLVNDYLNEGNVASLLLLPCEGLVVVLMVIRRTSREMSHRLGEWLVALAATCVPMLVVAAGDAMIPAAWGAVLLLAGLFVQVHAKLTLGRSLGCVPAHRGLRLRGPYRFVRHPMYAGYLLSHLAFLSLNLSMWNLAVYGLCYALQIPRILMEERLLSVDSCYRDYQTQVRFRLIPGLF